METIIKKAIEGGYTDYSDATKTKFMTIHSTVLDPLFWQALGKACGTWDDKLYRGGFQYGAEGIMISTDSGWKLNALRFYEINLTEGWEKAVKWLEELVDKK